MVKTNVIPQLLSSNTPATAGSLDIRGIKEPVPIPNVWLWVGLGAGALLAALVAWWLWRRKKRQQPTVEQIPVIPPHEKAMARLREALGLIHQPQPFSVLVSDTVRVYLEERFHLHAPERTTEEFLEELQSTPTLTYDQKQTLGEFLMGCDLVKFARYEPAQAEMQAIYDAAVRLVEETQPSPPVPDSAPAAASPAS